MWIFGTVLPREIVTKTFTIDRIVSGDYTLTLEPTLVAGVADIRSHLSVVKDPDKTDIDSLIVGYAGTGTFTV